MLKCDACKRSCHTLFIQPDYRRICNNCRQPKGVKMKGIALSILFKVLSQLLNEIDFKGLMDEVFDFIEDYVQQTSNKIDDNLVLPVIQAFRKQMDIPDND